jgi:hypothetical protein
MNLFLSGGAVATAAAVASPAFAASVALGATLEAVNFRGLALAAERLLSGGNSGRALWSSLFSLRLVMLAGVLFVAIRAGAEPAGLVIGLSMILPAAIVAAWRMRPPVDPTAPALTPEDPSWDLWNPWLARERTPEEEEDEAIRQ